MTTFILIALAAQAAWLGYVHYRLEAVKYFSEEQAVKNFCKWMKLPGNLKHTNDKLIDVIDSYLDLCGLEPREDITYVELQKRKAEQAAKAADEANGV